jgi:tetrahydromethanopterin S-methyltransferase subunit B
MGVTTWAVLQWASGPVENFVYGYWLGFIVALVLVAVAALRLAVLWRSAP